MNTIKTNVKRLYRKLLPSIVRNSQLVSKIKLQLLGHDWVYNEDYYTHTVEGPAARSSATIAKSIVNEFNPESVIDVGCGTGALLEALRGNGCKVFGLEYSEAGLEFCRARHLDVIKFDLEKDSLSDNRTFDVAVSMEVAEHLPEMIADRYIELLTQLSRNIIFTAAPPGQGGADHVNEQPPSYWIDKYQHHGFHYNENQSKKWRDSWKSSGEVEGWYHNNLMIFQQSL